MLSHILQNIVSDKSINLGIDVGPKGSSTSVDLAVDTHSGTSVDLAVDTYSQCASVSVDVAVDTCSPDATTSVGIEVTGVSHSVAVDVAV
ncbi:hypothetical protein [Azotobacter beijerinckii]|uniref:Uncharacterized protein n=1 Tax=Azotobacter beijerinckii TaxID=170623 RepID=A0A1I4B8A3_9GAMM|nr:hypothetical protein [Azotobacter beijerinckii]SFB05207.1 hypothetical protein SAMN04244571_01260 [Azotobacter beijerinckii]SFK65078.1 hypothetical protein SAMN04244574_01375 [Azotobacter beijerinckii]